MLIVDKPVPEIPQRKLMVSDFYISKYPVTFEQYDGFCEETDRMKPDDDGWGRGNLPVVHVTFLDAIAYCRWMTKKTGIRTELPTVAQWRFAARGGTQSKGFKFAGSNDFDEVGWNIKFGTDPTPPVGQKKPNELLIHDMTGLVWEWTRDIFNAKFDHYDTMDPQSRTNNHGVDFTEFINEAIDLPAGDLVSAFETWKRKQLVTKFHKIKKYLKHSQTDVEPYFQFAARSESRMSESLTNPDAGSGTFFFRQFRIMGFRVVMYP